jgi:hypothetical protein
MLRHTKKLAVFGAALLLPLMVTVADPQSVLGTAATAAEEKAKEKNRKSQSTKM